MGELLANKMTGNQQVNLFQFNNFFWNVLEADLCDIPNYIKNVLT